MKKADKGRILETEKQLIEAAKKDPALFAPLYDIYFRSIYLYIFKKVKNENIAGEIASDVFLKALINIKTYKHMGFPFSSWLYRIAGNEVNMYFRKHQKHQEVEIMEHDATSVIKEMEFADSEMERKKLIEGLNLLPLKYANLIELRYFEKFSFKEIADQLNITEGNAKIKVYRSIEKLKLIIGKLK